MRFWSRASVGLTLKCLWGCSIVVLLLRGYSSYSMLPVKVATHFTTLGIPDGWSSKREFFIILYSIISGINVLCLLTAVWIPRMLGGGYSRAVSVPNRDYWMATDERRAECGRLMQTMMFGILLLINFMFGSIFHSIVQGNVVMGRGLNIGMPLISGGLFLIFICIYLLTAFSRSED